MIPVPVPVPVPAPVAIAVVGTVVGTLVGEEARAVVAAAGVEPEKVEERERKDSIWYY